MDSLSPRAFFSFLLLTSLSAPVAIKAQPTVRVLADQVRGTISPTFYGLMTEEINHSYDGGLYAELVQNRTMQDDLQKPAHWSLIAGEGAKAAIGLVQGHPVPDTALTLCLQLDARDLKPGERAGVANDGFWGIPLRPSTTYRLSLFAQASLDGLGPLTAALETEDGRTVIASVDIAAIGNRWGKYTAELTTPATTPPSTRYRLALTIRQPGVVWFNEVSLFPPTYRDRPNGNRPDLMSLLVAMHPKFLRFPGGNFVEGDWIDTRFNWKETIGPIEVRPGHPGCWNYRASDGMGLLEFLEWCEDMGAEPVLAVYAGYSLRHQVIPAGAALQPFVDEALEEIEYVSGDAGTRWGGQRARDGHPAPFPLHYVEIGNEDGFDTAKTYDGRFRQFNDAIKAKYPRVQVIATTNGRDGLGQRQHISSRVPDLVDEHYYCSALQMMDNASRYDAYPRSGPKIFVGEWATREGSPTTNLIGAIGDAAWLAGLERNADIIRMSCYAPLLVNVNPGAWQWRSNLIGYDELASYGSPSYYVQKLFSERLGDVSLGIAARDIPTQTWQPPRPKPRPGQTEAPPLPPSRQVPTLFFSATRATSNGQIFVKAVNALGTPQTVRFEIAGPAQIKPDGELVTLAGERPEATNSLADPVNVVPHAFAITGLGPTFTRVLPPYSASVLTVETKKP